LCANNYNYDDLIKYAYTIRGYDALEILWKRDVLKGLLWYYDIKAANER
jgi:hypothetical protein